MNKHVGSVGLHEFSGFICLPQTLTLRSNSASSHHDARLPACSSYCVRSNLSLSLTVSYVSFFSESPPQQPFLSSVSSLNSRLPSVCSGHLSYGCTANLSFQWPHQETRTVCLSVSRSSRPLYPSYYNTNLSFP